MQMMINLSVRKEIVDELNSPDLLRETLDVVDIVIGFVSTGGPKSCMYLGDYVDKILKMKKRPFSLKVRILMHVS